SDMLTSTRTSRWRMITFIGTTFITTTRTSQTHPAGSHTRTGTSMAPPPTAIVISPTFPTGTRTEQAVGSRFGIRYRVFAWLTWRRYSHEAHRGADGAL